MLRRLSADDARFKTVVFAPGLNLVLADRTNTSATTDSRNSAGKSSIIELVHFLLGARADARSPFAKRPLKSITFQLDLDWPGITQPLTVRGTSSSTATCSAWGRTTPGSAAAPSSRT
ncbi:hypothetical protein AB0F71_25170 [Kitasatospora sp. NPDC028055]|uniref:hypothetical protein n=1 Tax=Kitasatospora sp. NPDC028055 TaxID=3155653 RepID=UPI0033D76834